jgi:hypothetical protein
MISIQEQKVGKKISWLKPAFQAMISGSYPALHFRKNYCFITAGKKLIHNVSATVY